MDFNNSNSNLNSGPVQKIDILDLKKEKARLKREENKKIFQDDVNKFFANLVRKLDELPVSEIDKYLDSMTDMIDSL